MSTQAALKSRMNVKWQSPLPECIVQLKLDNTNVHHIRETPEYIQAKRLICEKAVIQNRLREVDKCLRQLRTLGVGATALARQDLEDETNGFKKLENARLHQQTELKW
ncbi:MAG: hypothetical protein ACXU7H_08395 [Burkholderiaceae bacterium]